MEETSIGNDNKALILGNSSDIQIKYDETDNDSLEIKAGANAAALGIVLAADRGDNDVDYWKLNVANGGVLTLSNKGSTS